MREPLWAPTEGRLISIVQTRHESILCTGGVLSTRRFGLVIRRFVSLVTKCNVQTTPSEKVFVLQTNSYIQKVDL